MAEVVAVPRRLRLERRQSEPLPDPARVLHEFALGQRDRREGALERGIDQHRGALAAVAGAARPVAGILVRHHHEIVLRLAAVGHGPEQRIGVVGRDVLVDRDDPLAGETVQRGRAVERAPDLALGCAAGELDRDHRIKAGERLVHGDALDALDAEHGGEVVKKDRLHRHLANHARFARCNLADEGGEDRMAAARDRGYAHESVVFLQVHVAVGLAERRLGLQHLGIDQALDHDLRFRRHHQIDGLGAHHVDRPARERAGHRDLVEVLGHLLHRGVGDDGRTADNDRAGKRLAARLALLPMREDAGAQLDRRVHAEPPRRLELAAVVADVLDAGVGILGDVVAGRQVGRVVPARRRDRHRQAVERRAGLVEIGARDHDLLAGRIRDHARRNGIGDGRDPGRADLLEWLAEARAIDGRIGGKTRDQHRDVEAVMLGIGRVREQERLALGFRNAATVLPAHQRMHLGVFVDRLVHDHEQARACEREHVLVQVRVAARMFGRAVAVALQRLQNSARIAAATAKASASRLTKPVICRPSGRPSSCSTGSEIAGMAMSEACTVQAGSPVDPSPTGAAAGAERLTQTSHSLASSA